MADLKLKDLKLPKGFNFLILGVFLIFLLAVFLVLSGYTALFQYTRLSEFVGGQDVSILDVFEKTFGLTASLVIALVAVALAYSSLNISRTQTIMAELQTKRQ
ncbi:MAG: hypothetical protein ABJE99_00480 [Roseobacter sp.]